MAFFLLIYTLYSKSEIVVLSFLGKVVYYTLFSQGFRGLVVNFRYEVCLYVYKVEGKKKPVMIYKKLSSLGGQF